MQTIGTGDWRFMYIYFTMDTFRRDSMNRAVMHGRYCVMNFSMMMWCLTRDDDVDVIKFWALVAIIALYTACFFIILYEIQYWEVREK